MASIDQYKIKISVEGVEAVKSLSKAVGGLETTLAGIGFSAFVASAIKMADAIQDVADAAGLSSGYVKGLGNAIQQAGGNINDVDTIISKFYQNVDDLANGSDKAADAFAKVGIAGKDLLTMSRQDVLGKTLERLAEMGPSAERTALGIELFGKAFRSIDPKRLEEILKTQDFAALQKEIQNASAAYDAMQANIIKLQQAVFTAFEPIIGKIQDMTLSAEQAEKIIKLLGYTFAVAFSVKVVAQILEINKALKESVLITNLLGKNPIVKLLAFGAAAIAAKMFYDEVNSGVEKVTASVSDLDNVSMNSIRTYSEGIKELQKQLKAGSISQEEFNKKAEELATDVKKGPSAAATIEATQKEKTAKAAARTTQEIIKQNKIANDLQRTIISTIGMEENRAEIIKATAQIEADYANKRITLEGQISAERAKGKDANQGVIKSLQDQIIELNKQESISKQLTLDAIERNRLERERVALIDANVKKIQEMSDSEKNTNETLYKQLIINGNLTEKQAQRKLALDNAEAEKRATLYAMDAAIAKENDAVKKKILQDEYNRTEKNEQAKIDLIKRRYEQEDDLQESWKAGTIKALEEIVNATKPYKQAQDMIAATWGHLSNAIDTFVETGKFKFKDFARSVIADIAKIIAKAALLKAIQAGLSIFGITLPGFAEGGSVQGNKPIVVGEKGPELFVPPSAGTIVPNKDISQGQGKTLSAGNAAGPITNNYNTYNINALDAKSVAQVFAENRKAIFGANKMAEREMSYAGAR